MTDRHRDMTGYLLPGEFLYSATRAFRLAVTTAGFEIQAIDDQHLPLDVSQGTYKRLWGIDMSYSGKVLHLHLQDSGDLVLDMGFGNGDWWHSASSFGLGSFIRMQDDGDLVIYSREGKQLWVSNTGAY